MDETKDTAVAITLTPEDAEVLAECVDWQVTLESLHLENPGQPDILGMRAQKRIDVYRKVMQQVREVQS